MEDSVPPGCMFVSSSSGTASMADLWHQQTLKTWDTVNLQQDLSPAVLPASLPEACLYLPNN